MHRVLLGFHRVGHGTFAAARRTSRVGDCDVVQQLDDARQVGLFTDRQLQGGHAGAELGLEVVDRALVRRPLAVELVHEDRPGNAALLGEPPRDLRLHLDTLDGGDDEQREVGGLQRGDDVAHEIGVAGRIDDVHLVAVELERCDRKRHGDGPPLLFGIEVGDGRAVFDPAHARDRAGAEEERLRQGRLAGAAVADDCDVPNLGGGIRLHLTPDVSVAPWTILRRPFGEPPGAGTGFGTVVETLANASTA